MSDEIFYISMCVFALYGFSFAITTMMNVKLLFACLVLYTATLIFYLNTVLEIEEKWGE